MIISSKKDKETIKNLKNQISDLKNLIKTKPANIENKINRHSSTKINMSLVNKKTNKKNNNINKIHNNKTDNNSNNNILINNNNIVITTNNNSEIDEDNEIEYYDNNRCGRESHDQKNKSYKEEEFYTLSDDLKEKERNFSCLSPKNKNIQKNYKFTVQRINSKAKNKQEDFIEEIKNLKYARITQSQSNSKHKNNNISKNSKLNTVEHVKTENNFITVNINTNTFGSGGFYLKKIEL